MSDFPIRYDADAGVLHLAGEGGASVMLAVLLKAKFGEAYDPEILFHPDLAAIMIALRQHGVSQSPLPSEGQFDRAALQEIGRLIVSESWRSGWWGKSRAEQVEFVQNVVAAPHRLSDDQIEALFEDIENELYWRRKIIDAADAALT